MSPEGKTAIVTGESSGIARAIVLEISRAQQLGSPIFTTIEARAKKPEARGGIGPFAPGRILIYRSLS